MRKVIKKKIVEKCKKFSHCPYCEALNGEYVIVFLIHCIKQMQCTHLLGNKTFYHSGILRLAVFALYGV